MNDFRDIIIPANGKLNSDSDIVALPKGDGFVDVTASSSGRLNVVPREGNLGAVAKIKGNELESYSLPAGTNKVIGGGEDVEENAYITLIYNSNGDHTILQYNYNAAFTLISQDSAWGFTSGMEGIELHVIGTGNDKMIEFTDGVNEPRLFNKYNVRTGAYSSLGIGNINTLKPYPLVRPVASLNSDPNFGKNFIKDKLFQFCHRFHYDTGMVSTWGFMSGILTGSGLAYEYYPDKGGLFFSGDNEYFNKIQISYNVAYDSVDSVDIAVREMDVGLGAFGDWMLYDNIKHTTTGNKTYSFYNDKNKSSLSQAEFSRIFDDVPIKASISEILNSNRICYGQITKGYNNIGSSGATLEHVHFEFSGNNTLYGWYRYDYDSAATSASLSISITVNSVVLPEQSIIIYLYEGSNVEKYYLNSTSKLNTDALVTDYFVSEINSKTSMSITASNSGDNLAIANATGSTLYATGIRCFIPIKYKTFPSGSYVYLGINYYDISGRLFSTYADSSTKIYIEPQSGIYGTYSGNYDDIVNGIKYTITHLPPTGAAYWSWAYGGCSVKSLLPICLVVGDDAIFNYSKDIELIDKYCYINIVQALNRGYAYGNGYDINKGDRIRFVSYSTNTFGSLNKAVIINEDINFEILEYANGIAKINSINYLNNYGILTGGSNVKYIMAYIYSPNDNIDADNLTYHEIGSLMPITNGYHTATTLSDYGISAQNQTVSLPAIGVIDFGNCYRYPLAVHEITESISGANYVTLVSEHAESFSFSTLFDSKQADIGRINIYDPEYKQRETNAICYGGAYSEEGIFFNELNKFELIGNTVDLDNKYGNVYGLKQEGYTLNVLQQAKLTTIGVGVDLLSNADGSSNLQAVQSVLGNPRPFIENIGSIFASAIIKNDRNIYFPDIYSGEVYRKSANGLFPISDYGMSNYFRAKFKTLLDSGVSNIHMHGGWDPVVKMYILTMVDSSNASNNATLGFHEPSNSWFSFYSFVPERYGKIGNTLFLSFKSGAVWKHYSGSSDTCNFYGSGYASEIWVASSAFPNILRFNSIEVFSNEVWEAPENTGVTVYADAKEFSDPETYITYKGYMASRLKAGRFKPRPGRYVASFLRDALTTTGSFYVPDLQTGRQLKGAAILVRLKNSGTGDSVFRGAVINSAKSI